MEGCLVKNLRPNFCDPDSMSARIFFCSLLDTLKPNKSAGRVSSDLASKRRGVNEGGEGKGKSCVLLRRKRKACTDPGVKLLINKQLELKLAELHCTPRQTADSYQSEGVDGVQRQQFPEQAEKRAAKRV